MVRNLLSGTESVVAQNYVCGVEILPTKLILIRIYDHANRNSMQY